MKRVIVFLAFVLLAEAQVVPDRYIVELSTEPVGRFVGTHHKRLVRNDPEIMAHRTVIRSEQRRAQREIEQHGGHILNRLDTVMNALVVNMPASNEHFLRSAPGVRKVYPVTIGHAALDHSLPLQKVPDAWQQIGGMNNAGAGVKIAIIDSGIDVSHPAFLDSSLSMPNGFPKGDLAHTNNKVIVARNYSGESSVTDTFGHGTAVAMVAAGVTNVGPYGPITGVAPKAWLGNYKVIDNQNDAFNVILALEDAVNDGMDMVNMSLGNALAGYAYNPSDDPAVIAVENAVAAGKVVVIGAGNNGGQGPNTVTSPGTAPSAITVGSSANDRGFFGSIRVGGHAPYAAIPSASYPPFYGLIPNDPAAPQLITGPIYDVAAIDPIGLGCLPLPHGSLQGAIALMQVGCAPSIQVQNAQDAGAIAAILWGGPAPLDIWHLPGGALPSMQISYSDGLDLLKQIAAGAGGNANINFQIRPTPVDSSGLSVFSSKGPTMDYSIKPDLVAVGSNVYMAAPLSWPGTGYMISNGTSFATPHVAGAAALLMAARPGLTPLQYRSLLINNTSVFTPDGVTPIGVQFGGSGLLNVAAALNSTVTSVPASLSFASGDATTDYIFNFADYRLQPSRTITVTNVGATVDTFSIAPMAISGDVKPDVSPGSVQLQPGQSQDVTVHFSGPNLAGVYQGYLQILGTHSPVAARIPYWYATPTQVPRYLEVFNPTNQNLPLPTDATVGSLILIDFRFLDANGFPVTDGVTDDVVTVSGPDNTHFVSGGANEPGGFFLFLRANNPGTEKIHFQLGDVAADVAIRIN